MKYYAVTGVGAAITTIVVSLLPFGFTSAMYGVDTIGASGALYGLLLAYALVLPDRPILMFLFFPVPAKYFVMILGAMSLLFVDRRRRRRSRTTPTSAACCSATSTCRAAAAASPLKSSTAISNGR